MKRFSKFLLMPFSFFSVFDSFSVNFKLKKIVVIRVCRGQEEEKEKEEEKEVKTIRLTTISN